MYTIHLTLRQKSLFPFLVAIFTILEPNLGEKAGFALEYVIETFDSENDSRLEKYIMLCIFWHKNACQSSTKPYSKVFKYPSYTRNLHHFSNWQTLIDFFEKCRVELWHQFSFQKMRNTMHFWRLDSFFGTYIYMRCSSWKIAFSAKFCSRVVKIASKNENIDFWPNVRWMVYISFRVTKEHMCFVPKPVSKVPNNRSRNIREAFFLVPVNSWSPKWTGGRALKKSTIVVSC